MAHLGLPAISVRVDDRVNLLGGKVRGGNHTLSFATPVHLSRVGAGAGQLVGAVGGAGPDCQLGQVGGGGRGRGGGAVQHQAGGARTPNLRKHNILYLLPLVAL